MSKLLVVEDDPEVRRYIEAVARESGFATASAETIAEFRAVIGSFKPDLVILDLRLRDGDGIEAIQFMGACRFPGPVLVMSGLDRKLLDTATSYGRSCGLDMAGFVRKPVQLPELRALLEACREEAIGPGRLTAALDAGEIKPWFQPIFELKSPSEWVMTGVEALARWEHPVRGVLPPAEFLPLAQSSGLMPRLTEHVLSQTARAVRRWDDVGIRVRSSVNFDPELLQDLTWPDRIGTLWGQMGLAPNRLTVEVTENGVMADPQQATHILARFRLKGFGLSVDDFGTGYSSLIQLYRLPFSELKIDRSFVKDIECSEEARTIVRCLCELGRGLGLATCAEGVESDAAVQYLWEVGCRRVQGYLFCQPLPEDELLEASGSGEWRIECVPPGA